MNLMCPNCKKSGNRVIIQLHWTKKHHSFICGHCKLEFDLIVNERLPINSQLNEFFRNWLEIECYEEIKEIKNRVNSMSYEEKVKRLEELENKNKK